MEAFEIHMVQFLILVEAGEDDTLLAAVGVFVALQTLGADFLHHALHGQVDTAQRHMVGFEEFLENAVPGFAHRIHHAVGTDDHNTVHLV